MVSIGLYQRTYSALGRVSTGMSDVCGFDWQPGHLGVIASHPGKLSLAIPLWVGAMSTSESFAINRPSMQCTSPVLMVSQYKLMSDWGLLETEIAPTYGPCGSGRTFIYFCFILIKVDQASQNIFTVCVMCSSLICCFLKLLYCLSYCSATADLYTVWNLVKFFCFIAKTS